MESSPPLSILDGIVSVLLAVKSVAKGIDTSVSPQQLCEY